MSAGTQASAPTLEPDPHRAGADMPAAIGRVVRLVRKLIDYGRQLAATVQERATTPGSALFARPFGTADIAVILARITNGLRRAAALEARLCARAARGQDLGTAPIRSPDARKPRPARQVTPLDAETEPQPADRALDPRLARLPTEEQIAAEVRRRPIGGVIVDICCDLGIAPGNLDRAFWDEIIHAVIMYGGSPVRFLKILHERLFSPEFDDHPGHADPGWPAAAPLTPTPATGPP